MTYHTLRLTASNPCSMERRLEMDDWWMDDTWYHQGVPTIYGVGIVVE